MSYDDIDWNSIAEQYVVGVLGMIPEVGSMVAALVGIFWPETKVDVWAEVEQQTEALIQQNLDQLVQTQVNAALDGLQRNLNGYLTALDVGAGDPNYISEKWNVANGQFLQYLSTFQLPGYQTVLLPMFIQFANMHLGLLRDGVLGGASWGWTQPILDRTAADLTKTIADYRDYALSIYQQGLDSVTQQNPGTSSTAWTNINRYVCQMTLMTLDFVEMWAYFDVTKYPGSVTIQLTREIYSDALGTNTDSGAIRLPSPPSQPISQITVWGWDRIDAAQLTYPQGGGPNGVTTTARMGDSKGGSSDPPHGGVFAVAHNPVTVASASTGSIVNSMSFTFADGSKSNLLGGNLPGGNPTNWSFAGEILSSIHINGVSKYYGSADCVIYGFKYTVPMQIDPGFDDMLFVVTPAAKKQAPSAALAEARTTYWSRLRATAAS